MVINKIQTVGDVSHYLVPIQKRGILVEIKTCEKFYRRYIVDIPKIKF